MSVNPKVIDTPPVTAVAKDGIPLIAKEMCIRDRNKPIDDSLAVNQELQAVLQVTDLGMATSGNYHMCIRDSKTTANRHTVYNVERITIVDSTNTTYTYTRRITRLTGS